MKPLDYLDSVFEEHCKDLQEEHLPSHQWGEAEGFLSSKSVKSPLFPIKSLNGISSLDVVSSGEVVSFRCMVQQPLSAELYPCAYKEVNKSTGDKVWKTCKYRDDVSWPTDYYSEVLAASDNVWANRFPYYCVPVPGETAWVKQLDSIESLNNSLKCMVFDNKDCHSDVLVEDFKEQSTSNSSPSEENPPNALGYLVKIYASKSDALNLKVNDIIEVEGLLERASTAKIEEVSQASPSVVPAKFLRCPRVHSFFVKKVDHWNPILGSMPNEKDFVELVSMILRNGPFTTLLELRSSTINYIASGLGGDTVAAEYVLLHLCGSRLRSHSHAMGRFSLNLYGFADGVATFEGNTSGVSGTLQVGPSSIFSEPALAFLKICQQLMPRVSGVALTLDVLNNTNFLPYMDYNTEPETLVTGLLQLASNTLILFHESSFNQNSLNALGRKTTDALESLLLVGQVPYQCSNYSTMFDVDVSVIFLSTERSKFKDKIEIAIPIETQVLHDVTRVDPPNEAALIQIRSFLAVVVAQKELGICSDVSEHIANYFVEARQRLPCLASSMFTSWLSMARAYAFSFGETDLSRERWDAMMELEMVRLERVMRVK